MNLRESNCLGTPFALAAVKVHNTFKSKPLLLCPHWLLHIQTLVSWNCDGAGSNIKLVE